jgi:GNAT superfamily N-acetyltransferase
MFRRHHYLSHVLPPVMACHALWWEGNPVAFCASGRFPHPVRKDIIRCLRLVTLPDYQGGGLGVVLLEHVAREFTAKKQCFRIRSSQRQLLGALARSKRWVRVDAGINAPHTNIRTGVSFGSFRYGETFEFRGRD